MRRAMQRRVARVAFVVLAVAWAGCVESTWEAARRLDTVAGYNQFIRDHPQSVHVTSARERMAVLRVKTYRTIEAFEQFRQEYPQSQFMAELLELVEPLYFGRARRLNTPGAYREFLVGYPDGALTAKAQGNLAYVEQVLPSPTPEALRQFLARYEESDFRSEAERTLQIVASRGTTRIRRLGVRVDVAPNVTQGGRVASGFGSMIAKAYRERGIEVVALRADQIPGPELDGWIRVDYREAPAPSAIGAASLYSFCRVRLYHRDIDEPIWDRSFEAPADHLIQGAYGRDKTLFANSNYRFWQGFFVPVATWAVSETRVKRLAYPEQVRAIHVLGDAGALLLERGGVDFLDVSSPATIQVTERYRREVDLAQWHGVRLLTPNLAATFGNDGVELIRRSPQAVERLARWDAGEVGSVNGAILYDNTTLLVGGSRGLYAVRMNRTPLVPQKLLDGDVVGLEVHAGLIYVIRPDRLEIGLPKHLLQHITAQTVSLGKGFRADRVRRAGDSLFIFGRDQVVQLSIEEPARPTLLAQVEHDSVGAVADMLSDYEHRYILGERGLQVRDLNGTDESADYIQVGADQGLTLKGRFALLVGQNSVEVLDLAPYFDDGIDLQRSIETLPAKASETD